MANREQRSNREKKKPKQDKDKKKGAPPPSPFAQQSPVQFAKVTPQPVKK